MKLTPEDMGVKGEGGEQANMDLQMAMKFYDYDEPVIIILPAEALNAEEMSE
jgi:hypothetical protein